jgi:hypothetical protein
MASDNFRPAISTPLLGRCGVCREWHPRSALFSVSVKVWPSDEKKEGWDGAPAIFRVRLCESCVRDEQADLTDIQWDPKQDQKPA